MIADDMYVDDLITGGDNKHELSANCRKVSEILKSSEWRFNYANSKENFNLETNDASFVISEDSIKTLGILYNCKEDILHFHANQVQMTEKLTKRKIVSITAQLFDPLGLLCPMTVIPKLLIQQLWKEHVGWDASVPIHIEARWKEYEENLQHIHKLKISRHVVAKDSKVTELHGFADASQSAYGACIYARSLNENKEYEIRLVTAKSRVAPLKEITIPRLELCAAHLLAKLMNKVKTVLNIDLDHVYLWSDPVITLSWIKGSPSRWKTFVSNRAAKIEEITQTGNWYHVRSADNPADLISRGVLPQNLINCKLCWDGPSWLPKITKFNEFSEIPVEMPEQRQTISLLTTKCDINFISTYSSLTKLVNITACIFRFVNNSRNGNGKYNGELTVIERENALTRLIKLIQCEEYHNEISCMANNKELQSSSKILSLSPFLDKNGLIRVGRLSNSTLSYYANHQILLPRHKLTNFIVRKMHIDLFHCNSAQLLNSLREEYWPIHGKNLTKLVTHKCLTCFKFNAKTFTQKMGELPSTRITPSAPFSHVGIDFLVPVKGRERRARGYKVFKTYASLVICMVTKAIHLEVVSNLTTNAFLAALRRFVAGRGKPNCIYSDNATNFVGARTELQRIQNSFHIIISECGKTLSNEEINWRFIPPRSPHHGGLWEASVKLVKKHLIKSFGEVNLTWEEFSTVLCQIESIVNSRPLTPLSDDPNNLNPRIS